MKNNEEIILHALCGKRFSALDFPKTDNPVIIRQRRELAKTEIYEHTIRVNLYYAVLVGLIEKIFYRIESAEDGKQYKRTAAALKTGIKRANIQLNIFARTELKRITRRGLNAYASDYDHTTAIARLQWDLRRHIEPECAKLNGYIRRAISPKVNDREAATNIMLLAGFASVAKMIGHALDETIKKLNKCQYQGRADVLTLNFNYQRPALSTIIDDIYNNIVRLQNVTTVADFGLIEQNKWMKHADDMAIGIANKLVSWDTINIINASITKEIQRAHMVYWASAAYYLKNGGKFTEEWVKDMRMYFDNYEHIEQLKNEIKYICDNIAEAGDDIADIADRLETTTAALHNIETFGVLFYKRFVDAANIREKEQKILDTLGIKT